MPKPLTSKESITLTQRAKWDDFSSGYRIKAIGNPEISCLYIGRGEGKLPIFYGVPTTQQIEQIGGINIDSKAKVYLEHIANEAIMKGVRQVDIGIELCPPGEWKD